MTCRSITVHALASYSRPSCHCRRRVRHGLLHRHLQADLSSGAGGPGPGPCLCLLCREYSCLGPGHRDHCSIVCRRQLDHLEVAVEVEAEAEALLRLDQEEKVCSDD